MKNSYLTTLLFSLLSFSAPLCLAADSDSTETMRAEANQSLEFMLLPGENWYGGFNSDGQRLKENNEICRRMAELHVAAGPKIADLAKQSATSGEPIVRSLEYQFPHRGYAAIKDQFLLGTDLLVAPVLEKGARSRKIIFPPGTWKGDDGSTVSGPTELVVNAPLERLPHYRLQR